MRTYKKENGEIITHSDSKIMYTWASKEEIEKGEDWYYMLMS